jgi:sulfite reductase (NADPH) flavoprotein alpha-component
MKKKGKELYEWLQNGATLYVCGAKEPMSVNVENALVDIVQEYGSKRAEEAVEFINQLKSEGRYLKDVY